MVSFRRLLIPPGLCEARYTRPPHPPPDEAHPTVAANIKVIGGVCLWKLPLVGWGGKMGVGGEVECCRGGM